MLKKLDSADVVIIGGGIIGCSIALELANTKKYGTIFLIEKRRFLGDATSTRNSYVIHAGIYYPKDSLKARFCVEGNPLLYEFCRKYKIDHLKSGKLIIATNHAELKTLEELFKKGRENGADSLRLIDKDDIKKIEPNINAVSAIHSPSSGVFDVAQWFRIVEGLLYNSGVFVLKNTEVKDIQPYGQNFEIITDKRGRVGARLVINSAGLFSDDIANLLGNSYKIYPCRGDYFIVTGPKREEIKGSVYPMPSAIALGVHLTKLVDGNLLIGPDARYIEDKEDYKDLQIFNKNGEIDTNSDDFKRFYEETKAIWPSIEKSDMKLAHCGIRPKLNPPGDNFFKDFFIKRDENYPNVIHLIGIESPGLTSSLAIARYVRKMIE